MNKSLISVVFVPVCGLAVWLSGCSDQPEVKAKRKVEPVTGQTALYRMYQVARSWAKDAEVLKMNSIHLTEVPAVRGQAGAWQTEFTSAHLYVFGGGERRQPSRRRFSRAGGKLGRTSYTNIHGGRR